MGFAVWTHRVKTLGYKGIKMGISFIKDAWFIGMAGTGTSLQVHTGLGYVERWQVFGTTHSYQWESS